MMTVDEAFEKLSNLELYHLLHAANCDLTFEECGAEDTEENRVVWEDLMNIKSEDPDVEFDLPELDNGEELCDLLLDDENFQ